MSINKLSVSFSPICLSELVAMVAGDGFTARSDVGYYTLNTKWYSYQNTIIIKLLC